MTLTSPEYPHFREALSRYGDSVWAQSKALGIPYSTLLDYIREGPPQQVVRFAALPEEIFQAVRTDVTQITESAPLPA